MSNESSERQSLWIAASERVPTHIYSVLVWVVGGSLHHGEDYADIGIYNSARDKWQTNNGDDDIDVEVSHWCDVPLSPSAQAKWKQQASAPKTDESSERICPTHCEHDPQNMTRGECRYLVAQLDGRTPRIFCGHRCPTTAEADAHREPELLPVSVLSESRNRQRD